MSEHTQDNQIDTLRAWDKIEEIVANGNLSNLTPKERTLFYTKRAESCGLNPLTQPFSYITLQGKLTLYANKDAAEQVRKRDGMSIEILSRERQADIYLVTAKATDKEGRSDESIAAVCLTGLKGNDLCNAYMKCETKAKRRATFSLGSLGMLDETEIETIKDARKVDFHPETGAVIEYPINDPLGTMHGEMRLINKDEEFSLSSLIFEARADQAKFFEEYKITSLRGLNIQQLDDATKRLNRKIAKMKASEAEAQKTEDMSKLEEAFGRVEEVK